jgi:hypothetical protein
VAAQRPRIPLGKRDLTWQSDLLDAGGDLSYNYDRVTTDGRMSVLLKQLDELREQVDLATGHLATSRKIPEEVEQAVYNVADARERMPGGELNEIDPYLLVALDKGLLGAFKSFRSAVPPEAARRRMRVALEQIRQALRDLGDEGPVAETRPAKELAQWMDAALDVPQTEMANLLGVSSRQYQRWVSLTDPTEPHGKDAARLRMLARLVAHLRHAWTGPGVVMWLTSPHPSLDGVTPASLLTDIESFPRLRRLASAARSSRAA